MVSAELLQIKKGSYSIGKDKGSSNDKQYLPDTPSVENTEPYPWTEDYLDFKKFIHDELKSLKASISKRPIPESSGPPNRPIDYERSFIRSMEDRILSLERQLEQKQAIINKLLATPKEDRKAFHVEEARNPKRANPKQQIEKNTHNERKADNGPIEISKEEDNKKKNKQKVSEIKENKGVLSDSSDETNEKQQKQSSNKGQDLSEQGAPKSGNSNKRKRIFLVGDSIINGINENGISNTHHISVRIIIIFII